MKNKIYGYARISTVKQNLPRQVDKIKAEYPDAIIITEAWTGTEINRPAFDKLLKAIKPGDTIVFDEVSRMSRNAEEGFKLYEELFNKGVNLIFLTEPYINTEAYRQALQTELPITGTEVDFVLEGVKKMFMALAKKQVKIAFDQAEKEIEYLHRRTSEGVKKAHERYEMETALGIPHKKNDVGRQQGAKITSKKSLPAKEIIRKHSKSFDGTLSDIECIKLTGVNRETYYKYKRELLEGLA